MAYQYEPAQGSALYSSSPASMWSMSRDLKLARGPYASSDTFHPLSSDGNMNTATDSAPEQTGQYDYVDESSAFYVSESRCAGVFELGLDDRYGAAGWKEHGEGDMHTGSGGLVSGDLKTMGQEWAAAGWSQAAVLSSPLSVGAGSELFAVFADDIPESDTSYVDRRESREIVALGNESYDGDGPEHNEADNQNPVLDSDQLEALCKEY